MSEWVSERIYQKTAFKTVGSTLTAGAGKRSGYVPILLLERAPPGFQLALAVLAPFADGPILAAVALPAQVDAGSRALHRTPLVQRVYVAAHQDGVVGVEAF